jgi:adenine-specific DNA-methyltransferase
VPAIRPTNPHARRLRREATGVEQKLWLEVRDRRLGGFKFHRQATVGPFVVDFLCAQKALSVELDGSQHTEEGDRKRTAFLEARGYRVLRFWNNDLSENLDGVVETILSQLTALPDAHVRPSPNPLPQAGEG